MKPTLLILTAGSGNRYKGLKQIDSIGPNGETIIDYSIFDAINAGFGKVVFVIRKSFAPIFEEIFNKKLQGKIEVEYVYQELENIPEGITFNHNRTKPWGTGHAVLVAKYLIHEPFLVINADDFYGSMSYKILINYLKETEKLKAENYCMVGYRLENTLSRNGYVSRGICEKDDSGFLLNVVERTQIGRADEMIVSRRNDNTEIQLSGNELVSMNFWGFTPSLFQFLESYFMDFIKENGDSPDAEFFLPFVINELISKRLIKLKVLESTDKWFGLTYKADKDSAISSINELIENGTYPKNTPINNG